MSGKMTDDEAEGPARRGLRRVPQASRSTSARSSKRSRTRWRSCTDRHAHGAQASDRIKAGSPSRTTLSFSGSIHHTAFSDAGAERSGDDEVGHSPRPATRTPRRVVDRSGRSAWDERGDGARAEVLFRQRRRPRPPFRSAARCAFVSSSSRSAGDDASRRLRTAGASCAGAAFRLVRLLALLEHQSTSPADIFSAPARASGGTLSGAACPSSSCIDAIAEVEGPG